MIKIVLFGPGLSGKRTIITALYRLVGGDVERFEVVADWRDQHMDVGIALTTGGLVSKPVSVITFSGTPYSLDSWSESISKASGILFVIDPRRKWLQFINESVNNFNHHSPKCNNVAIQLTKSDLRESDATFIPEEELQSILSVLPNCPWFNSRVDDPCSMKSGVEHLAEAAINQEIDGNEEDN